MNVSCPSYSSLEESLLDSVAFWVEGVALTLVAAVGVLGNTLASFIVVRKEMRNSFNLLLVSLACFDSTYLLGAMLEAARRFFRMETDLHIVLFPHVLYPVNQVGTVSL